MNHGNPTNQESPSDSKERMLMLLVTALFFLLFGRLYYNLNQTLKETEEAYSQGRAIHLRKGMSRDSLRHILLLGNYFPDRKDLDLAADSLLAKVEAVGSLDNLGMINKRDFEMVVPTSATITIGGEAYRQSIYASRQRLGFDSTLYRQELTRPQPHPAYLLLGKGPYALEGTILDFQAKKPIANVLVMLQKHGLSTVEDTSQKELFYARTGSDGQFSFNGLAADSGYSVLPLKPGYEFGSRQGTPNLSDNLSVTFRARPHKIRIIGSVPYSQLKDDRALTVRTPSAFRASFLYIMALLLGSYWAVHFFWSVRRFQHDPFLLPVLLLLVGISLLALLAIQDPLQDTLHAYTMAWRGALGLIVMAAVSQINVGRLYTFWWYDALFNFRTKSSYRLMGWSWLLAALLLALATLFFGSGPEGSGVKVNLDLGVTFQPSEVTKYLLLVFLAGFFASNGERLSQLSDARWRFVVSFWLLVGVALLVGFYLLLGDMGPAMVICFTFLIFYSIARKNLWITLLTGCLYCLLLYQVHFPPLLALLFSIGAGVGLMVYQKNFHTTKLYGWLALLAEAPIILILIISAFVFGDQIPKVGDRLADRMGMWQHPWNNDVYGGDHLAHAYWSLTSGGFSGQGLGKGHANTMPAAHTDMILPSIGEELGWLGLAAIFLLFLVLIHRILIIARKAGQPFSFYLCAGIGIATGLQLLIIAGGSLGIIPLTGISVPFLSFGSTALVLNLIMMGVVFSISNRPGVDIQQEYISHNYDSVLMAGNGGYLVGIMGLIVTLAYVQLWAEEDYIVRPSRVINRSGVPVYSYNPRIVILTRQLAAGNIYDRNGLLLATSEPQLLDKNLNTLSKAGLNPIKVKLLSQKRLQRYYPFEEQMFFWVGDYNTRLFWDQSNGYYAESAHLSQLRGFDTRPEKGVFESLKFQSDRFSKPITRSFSLVSYDYSTLTDILCGGIDGEEAAALKAKNRDIKLTVDAALQTELQQALTRSDQKKRRISVVVLDALSGDVLASALNPLPNLKSPEAMLIPEKDRPVKAPLVTDRDLGMTYATAPGSTAKVLTAAAAFNKLGRSAADTTYHDITLEEIIRNKPGTNEPYGRPIDMKRAIVESSNVYFIRIANENSLEYEMSDLYFKTGMFVDYVGGYTYSTTLTPDLRDRYLRHWSDSVFVVNRDFYKNWKGIKRNRYNSEFSGLAWGQGQLTSTPAAMARMAAVIANNGKLTHPRYLLEAGGKLIPDHEADTLMRDPSYASLLQSFMIEQSNVGGKPRINGSRVAGKSGTPERKHHGVSDYDGWYVFFAPKPGSKSHTVVCVRVEWGGSSGVAMKLANDQIAPILQRRGYLGSF